MELNQFKKRNNRCTVPGRPSAHGLALLDWPTAKAAWPAWSTNKERRQQEENKKKEKRKGKGPRQVKPSRIAAVCVFSFYEVMTP
jgi:hypothetical protein